MLKTGRKGIASLFRSSTLSELPQGRFTMAAMGATPLKDVIISKVMRTVLNLEGSQHWKEVLGDKVRHEVEGFARSIPNVENNIFNEYQNFELAFVHGERSQLVISCILQHLREILLASSSSVLKDLLDKITPGGALYSCVIGWYYVDLLNSFKSALLQETLKDQHDLLIKVKAELNELRELAINRDCSNLHEIILFLKGMKEIECELALYIETVVIKINKASMSDCLKDLGVNARKLNVRIIQLLQRVCSPTERFTPVSSMVAAHQYPKGMSVQCLKTMSTLTEMRPELANLLFAVESYETDTVGSTGQVALWQTQPRKLNELFAGYPAGVSDAQYIDPRSSRGQIIAIIDRLFALQRRINTFIFSNESLIPSTSAIGDIMLSNHPLLQEVMQGHLKLALLLLTKAITESENALACIKTRSDVLAFKPQQIQLTVETLEIQINEIKKIHGCVVELSDKVGAIVRQCQNPVYVRNVLFQFLDIGVCESRVLKELDEVGYNEERIAKFQRCRDTIAQFPGYHLLLNEENGAVTPPSTVRSWNDDGYLARRSLSQDGVGFSISDDDARSERSNTLSRSHSGLSQFSIHSFRVPLVSPTTSVTILLFILYSNHADRVLHTINDAIKSRPSGNERNRAAKKELGQYVRDITNSNAPLTQEAVGKFDFDQLWGLVAYLLNICFISDAVHKREYYVKVTGDLTQFFQIVQGGEVYPVPVLKEKMMEPVELPFNPTHMKLQIKDIEVFSDAKEVDSDLEGAKKNSIQESHQQPQYQAFSQRMQRCGFSIHPIATEGNCYFEALADQLAQRAPQVIQRLQETLPCASISHIELRRLVAGALQDRQSESSWCERWGKRGAAHITRMLRLHEYAEGEDLFVAGALALGVTIICLNDSQLPESIFKGGGDAILYLAYVHGNHYESLRGQPLEAFQKEMITKVTSSEMFTYQQCSIAKAYTLGGNVPALAPAVMTQERSGRVSNMGEMKNGASSEPLLLPIDLYAVLNEAKERYKEHKKSSKSLSSVVAILEAEKRRDFTTTIKTAEFVDYVLHKSGTRCGRGSLRIQALEIACERTTVPRFNLVQGQAAEGEVHRALRDLILFQMGVTDFSCKDPLSNLLTNLAKWAVVCVSQNPSICCTLIQSLMSLSLSIGSETNKRLEYYLRAGVTRDMVYVALKEMVMGVKSRSIESHKCHCLADWLANYNESWKKEAEMPPERQGWWEWALSFWYGVPDTNSRDVELREVAVNK